MADNEHSQAAIDKKQQAKEAKRKQRQEELQNLDDIEKYKIEEKAAKRNQKEKVKQDQHKEENKEKKPSVAPKEKGVKKSRPVPAKAPFHFFKDEQKGKNEEEIQVAWKAISPEDKQVIICQKDFQFNFTHFLS